MQTLQLANCLLYSARDDEERVDQHFPSLLYFFKIACYCVIRLRIFTAYLCIGRTFIPEIMFDKISKSDIKVHACVILQTHTFENAQVSGAKMAE